MTFFGWRSARFSNSPLRAPSSAGRRLRLWGGAALALVLLIAPSLRAAEDERKIAGEEEADVRYYWEWLNEDRITDQGVQGSLVDAWRESLDMPQAAGGAYWEPIGPAPLFSGSVTYSGRINAVAIHPQDPNTIYIGAALGGVWKSTNAGASWTPLTDDQPSLAMGSIAIDPANPETVYVGTGEQNFAIDSYYGLGVLKSTNGGTTWTRLGVDVFTNLMGGGATISRLVVDPQETNRIYVASTYGLFISTDGGTRWTRKLGDRTEVPITDLAVNPTNPEIVYAAMSSPFIPPGPSNKGLYKSTDRGNTWSKLDIGIEPAEMGRMNFALAPSNPQIMYVSISDFSPFVRMTRLKTTDGGQTWETLPECRGGCEQGFYNNVLVVDPTDPNTVYHGAVGLFRTFDGGKTWANNIRVHPDHHALVYDQAGNLYIGQDGGLFRINAQDDSTSNLNTNLALTQYYPGAVMHPDNPNFLLGGTQDNGSNRRSATMIREWTISCGGDGMFQAIDGRDGDPDNVWYCAAQFLAIRKTTNNGRTQPVPATTGIDRSDAHFIAPYIMDPNNSQILIAGTRSVWRTEDGAGFWERNSPPLMTTGGLRSLAFAPLDSGRTYYAGNGVGQIWRTTDTGRSWTEVSQGQGMPTAVVNQIRVSPLDSNRVYAAFSGFGRGHVYRTTNGGFNWANISGNLPNVPATALLIDTSRETPVLYVGTDVGVFRSFNDGITWENFNAGFPVVRVEELVFHPDTRTLVAATHGRSMWRIVVP